jgi:hypothetical protein
MLHKDCLPATGEAGRLTPGGHFLTFAGVRRSKPLLFPARLAVQEVCICDHDRFDQTYVIAFRRVATYCRTFFGLLDGRSIMTGFSSLRRYLF